MSKKKQISKDDLRFFDRCIFRINFVKQNSLLQGIDFKYGGTINHRLSTSCHNETVEKYESLSVRIRPFFLKKDNLNIEKICYLLEKRSLTSLEHPQKINKIKEDWNKILNKKLKTYIFDILNNQKMTGQRESGGFVEDISSQKVKDEVVKFIDEENINTVNDFINIFFYGNFIHMEDDNRVELYEKLQKSTNRYLWFGFLGIMFINLTELLERLLEIIQTIIIIHLCIKYVQTNILNEESEKSYGILFSKFDVKGVFNKKIKNLTIDYNGKKYEISSKITSWISCASTVDP